MFSDFKTLLIHVARKEGREAGWERRKRKRQKRKIKGFKNIEL